MKLLIVAATKSEIRFLNLGEGSFFSQKVAGKHTTDVLITGVGVIATTFALTELLGKSSYDLIINAGIAGSFNRTLPLGEIVEVTEEITGDLGAEDDEVFLDIFELKLAGKNQFPFSDGKLVNHSGLKSAWLDSLIKVTGLTVSKVHGNERSIEKIKSKYAADIETMEGAAFFYVCKQKNVRCLQVRAISNFVEKRNRDHWEIDLALTRLNDFLKNFTDELPDSL